MFQILAISFNPHLHVGGDIFFREISRLVRSFNPHLHVGGDNYGKTNKTIHYCFNPHLHVGGDCALVSCCILMLAVSILTSTWEVTPLYQWRLTKYGVSIHTSTWEVTIKESQSSSL